MLSRLVYQCSSQQLRGIEFADRKAVEPALALAGQALDSGAAAVPSLDVDSIRTALAEEQ